MKKLLVPLILISLTICSCNKKTLPRGQEIEQISSTLQAIEQREKGYETKSFNPDEYDPSIKFDEAEEFLKQLEKENLIHSTQNDRTEVWHDGNGTLRIEKETTSSGYVDVRYYDENEKEKFYLGSDGHMVWYDYDDVGRCIYEKNNATRTYPEAFYEYVNTRKFQITKQIIPGWWEKWYYKTWPDTFHSEDVVFYEKYDDKEYWYMRNPLMVTTMREAYSKKLNRKNCREASFSESRKIIEELYDESDHDENLELPELFFRTKCHFTTDNKQPDNHFWFYSDGETVDGYDSSPYDNQEYYFPLDMPPFTSVELYYHYTGTVCADEDECTYRISDVIMIDGWKVLDEPRFPGQKYIAADYLKIRSGQSQDSAQTGRIERDESVTVIENGNPAVIDGIESAWVKVRKDDGTEGWSFAGYLTDGRIYKNKPWSSR